MLSVSVIGRMGRHDVDLPFVVVVLDAFVVSGRYECRIRCCENKVS